MRTKFFERGEEGLTQHTDDRPLCTVRKTIPRGRRFYPMVADCGARLLYVRECTRPGVERSQSVVRFLRFRATRSEPGEAGVCYRRQRTGRSHPPVGEEIEQSLEQGLSQGFTRGRQVPTCGASVTHLRCIKCTRCPLFLSAEFAYFHQVKCLSRHRYRSTRPYMRNS